MLFKPQSLVYSLWQPQLTKTDITKFLEGPCVHLKAILEELVIHLDAIVR